MAKLNKSLIDRTSYEGDGSSRHVVWDSSLSGFGLRVYPTGKKAFILSYRVNGRKRLMTLGAYGALTVDQARKRAMKLLVDVEDGVDILEEKTKSTQGDTIQILCDAYLERYAKKRKKTWKDDEGRINKYLLPAWKHRKIIDIKRSDVANLHHKIGNHAPYQANRVVELVSKMYELAKQWGYAPETSLNPAWKIEPFKEIKRDRWVTPEELPKLAKAINTETNTYARYAIWLYLLTGLRKSELLGIRWDQVNLNSKELHIPDTKSGKPLYLPLSTEAITALKSIPKQNDNPYVFPGRVTGQHLVNISKPWNRIRRAAGITDVRLHDLRRTVGSWLAQSGNSLHLIGRVLNHSSPTTTQVYARFGEDHVRKALDEHGKRLMKAAKAKTTKG